MLSGELSVRQQQKGNVMEIDYTEVSNPDEIKMVKESITKAWDEGALYKYKKISPDSIIKVTPQKNANDSIDYKCFILNMSGEMLGSFSIVGDRHTIKESILIVKNA